MTPPAAPDRFFGADPGAPASLIADWDGSPKIKMTENEATTLYELVPHYHVCVLGPVPFGGDPNERVRISIDHIIAPNQEDAEAMVWQKVAQACQTYNHPLHPDEWDIAHIVAYNCC